LSKNYLLYLLEKKIIFILYFPVEETFPLFKKYLLYLLGEMNLYSLFSCWRNISILFFPCTCQVKNKTKYSV